MLELGLTLRNMINNCVEIRFLLNKTVSFSCKEMWNASAFFKKKIGSHTVDRKVRYIPKKGYDLKSVFNFHFHNRVKDTNIKESNVVSDSPFVSV